MTGKIVVTPEMPLHSLERQLQPARCGRIDYEGRAGGLARRRPRRASHRLTEMPNAHGEPQPLEKHLTEGYLALSWSDEGATYCAVSDAASDELENFAVLFRAATAGSEAAGDAPAVLWTDRMSDLGH